MSHATCCVLSYNRPELLAETLRTLRANAASPLELIVHDDGSSDPAVLDLLHGLLASGEISTLITNPPGHNQGQGTALNRMFRMATGDPIIKIDHDLLFKPGWLSDVQVLLEANRGHNRVRKGLAHERTPEPLIGLLGLLHYYYDPVHTLKTKLADHFGWTEHTHILGSAFAVTRRCWEALGPFEEHSAAFAEDWVFQRRVTESPGDPDAHREDRYYRSVGPKGFVCALPPEDLCTNVGMGYGPSTVNVAEGKVATINEGPVIL